MSTKSRDFDALVLGGGLNGLVAATALAQAGFSVCLVEQHPKLGGMAAPSLPTLDGEGAPELPLVHDFGLLDSDVVTDLGLADHGLALLAEPLTAARARDGREIRLAQDLADTSHRIAHFSKRDAERWPDFLAAVSRVVEMLRPFERREPTFADLARLFADAQMVRWATRSVAEVLAELFESELLKTSLAALAVNGHSRGPMAAGTGLALLRQLAGSTEDRLRPFARPASAQGHPVAALTSAARAAGVALRVGTSIETIAVRRGGVVGVRFEGKSDGEGEGGELTSRVVLSSLSANTTLLGLVGPEHLEVRAVRRLRNWIARGSWACFALDVPSAGLGKGVWSGRTFLNETLVELEQAADSVKRGAISRQPMMEVVRGGWGSLPPVSGRGARARTSLVLGASHVPIGLRRSERKRFESGLVARLLSEGGAGDRARPGLLLTPDFWRDVFAAVGGSIHHGDGGLEQSFALRGAPGCRGARTPIKGLFLCGAGAHPGGGVSGLPGWNAAQAAADELR